MLTMYFKTPLVLLCLNPALSKLHLINLLKALVLPVPKAVHPHLNNQSQWNRQAHLLPPRLLRVGSNTLRKKVLKIGHKMCPKFA